MSTTRKPAHHANSMPATDSQGTRVLRGSRGVPEGVFEPAALGPGGPPPLRDHCQVSPGINTTELSHTPLGSRCYGAAACEETHEPSLPNSSACTGAQDSGDSSPGSKPSHAGIWLTGPGRSRAIPGLTICSHNTEHRMGPPKPAEARCRPHLGPPEPSGTHSRAPALCGLAAPQSLPPTWT